MANPREEYFKQLVGGIEIRTKFSIFNKNISIGTLGMIVYDLETGEPLGLSNSHILRTGIGGLVYQPGISRRTKRKRGSKYVIGKILRVNRRYDCGVFEIFEEKRAISNLNAIYGLHGNPSKVVQWKKDLRVKKVGKNTGVTYGIVTGINPEDSKAFRIRPNPDKPAKNNEISIGGDSGAIWVTDEEDYGIVGLHYAGDPRKSNSEYSSAFPAETIAEKLNISFFAL